ncbi:hypothetical protein ACO03_17970 [Pantoea ananatis]|nr:hypothetical protein ACO03_17970 [Pantoea ananatis]
MGLNILVTYCSKLPGMTHLAAFPQHECHRLIPQKMRDGKDILNNGLGMIWRMGFQDEVMPR